MEFVAATVYAFVFFLFMLGKIEASLMYLKWLAYFSITQTVIVCQQWLRPHIFVSY